MTAPDCDICGSGAAEYEEEEDRFVLLGCPDCGYDAAEGDDFAVVVSKRKEVQ